MDTVVSGNLWLDAGSSPGLSLSPGILLLSMEAWEKLMGITVAKKMWSNPSSSVSPLGCHPHSSQCL